MKINVTGICTQEDVIAVSSLGVDMISLDFRVGSPNFVPMITSKAGFIPDYSRERLIHIRVGENQTKLLSHAPERVGIFADDMPQNIVTRVYNYQLDCVELAGEESCVMIENLKNTLIPDIAPAIRIIKTIHIDTPDDFSRCESYIQSVDYFHFILSKQDNNALFGTINAFESYTYTIPYIITCDEFIDTNLVSNLRMDARFIGVSIGESYWKKSGTINLEDLQLYINRLGVKD